MRMKKWVLWTVPGLLVVAAAGFFLLRPPQVEPFVPTKKEAAQLALYRQPESWFLQHLKKPPIELDGQRLDPKFQYMIEQGGDAELAARIMRMLFATAPGRRYVRAAGDRHWILFAKVTAPMRKVEDRKVDGRGGLIHVRIYWPQTPEAGPLPMLVYAHGGGYLFGSVAALDRPMRLIANEAHAIVVSMDYRLAPEHPYPAASDDGEDVFLWACANAAALGGDPMRVAFGGDSAGGHVAINVAQRQLLKGAAPPAMLLLYYPAVGLPYGTRSGELFGKGYGLDTSFFDYLLPKVFPGKTLDDPRDDLMDPLNAESLARMPPTILSTAGFDILRDPGRAFAGRLRDAGVPVTYRNEASLIHSYLQFSGIIADADRAASETARLFGERMRASPAEIPDAPRKALYGQ
ncbi:MAG: alpha/beta hydrolase [Pseudoxanthomonas sp.]